MELDRIRLTVRYDGTEFAGSQHQPQQRTVTGTLKAGLEAIVENQVHLVWASRTDAGVHAEGNVCAFDAQIHLPAERLPVVLRAALPADLEVRAASVAQPHFHPRFDAINRVYVYRVYRAEDVPVDRKRYTSQVVGHWDMAAVAEARFMLAGTRSFAWCSDITERNGQAVWRRQADQCICMLDPIEESEHGPELIWTFRANRFLRHMICRMAGLLTEVALGHCSLEQVSALITGASRFQFKPAPAHGLTLWSIEYAPPNGVLGTAAGGS